MDKNLAPVYQTLQKLIGLHRQLLDVVRLEREALVNADLNGVQESTYAKEGLIEGIKQQESERLKALTLYAVATKRPLKELTISNLIIQVQGTDLKAAELLRSSWNALTTLIQRIAEQNKYNGELVAKSLEHVRHMKKNVLGESTPHTETYNPQGQKSSAPGQSRLISTEV